jgi:type II secretory pathway component GspD/PulD (secretin)
MADIRLITIENNDVAKVSEIVRSLWDERLKMSLAKGQEEQPSDRIAIAEDPLTRTMLVASSRSSFEEIQNLVAKLDVPPVVDGVFRTFVVRHNDISKAADLLREVFDKGLYIGTTDTRNLPEAATKVTIVPDLRSSSLIVSASPQNLAIVESLLAQIDREDVPDLPAGARFFQIQHADVVNLADMLERMFEACGPA